MKPANLLVIMSDEHAREGLGCYGGPVARTPNLDRLAAGGTRFANAYTNSPICVPGRAALATGRYVHQIGAWSSAEPYDGTVEGWGHRLLEASHEVVSIGKLHYRDTRDPNGFGEEILPMHVVDGVGWLRGLLRKDPPVFEGAKELAEGIGPGESSYTHYDRQVCQAACDWLGEEGRRERGKPWLLFVSFVSPHYPLTAPREFYDLYEGQDLGAPGAAEVPNHPVLQELRRFFDYDDYFDEAGRKVARRAYYGLCSFLDDNVGKVLGALEESGLTGDTRILYTSDHGEMLGSHGFWTKSVMYEDSVGVPLILSGPEVPEAHVAETPVSLVDCYPTFLEGLGLSTTAAEAELPGQSLFELAEREDPNRVAFSEYHDGGAPTGFFMVRWRRWKYVHYVGHEPQLFDLDTDPHEMNDLGANRDYARIQAEGEAKLRAIVDPDEADARAFRDQAAKIAELGGKAALLETADFNHTPLPAG